MLACLSCPTSSSFSSTCSSTCSSTFSSTIPSTVSSTFSSTSSTIPSTSSAISSSSTIAFASTSSTSSSRCRWYLWYIFCSLRLLLYHWFSYGRKVFPKKVVWCTSLHRLLAARCILDVIEQIILLRASLRELFHIGLVVSIIRGRVVLALCKCQWKLSCQPSVLGSRPHTFPHSLLFHMFVHFTRDRSSINTLHGICICRGISHSHMNSVTTRLSSHTVLHTGLRSHLQASCKCGDLDLEAVIGRLTYGCCRLTNDSLPS